MSLQFEHEYILENDRVILRPLKPDDQKNLLDFALNEPELWLYSYKSAAGEEGMKEYINAALKARAEHKEYPFIVIDKQNGRFAGSTRYYDILPVYQTLQLGYTWYGKDFQRTGLNRNCKLLLLELAFEKLGFERVEFRADNNNAKSIAAMKAIGCKAEGVMRSNMPLAQGGRRDSIVLSILKNEWNTEVKEALRNKIRIYQ